MKSLDLIFYIIVIVLVICMILTNSYLDSAFVEFQYIDTFSDTREMKITKSKVTNSDNKVSSSVNSVQSAKTKEIVKMSDKEVWKLMTEGKFSSHGECNAYAKSNTTEANKFFDSLMKTIEVPVWKWNNGNKKKSTMKVTVNKYLADYFTDFLTDLHNLPEKYCIDQLSGYNFRKIRGGVNYSAHSWGNAIDINYEWDGMKWFKGKDIGPKTWPYRDTKGMPKEQASKVCTYDSSWIKLANDYDLDWGGYWEDPIDPMHFSVVGDNTKGKRDYKPFHPGRSYSDR